MPSEKILSTLQLHPTVICFGDITRDEINNVLTEAGISLAPPSKTPFATGIRRRRRRKSKPSIASKLNDTTPTDISPSPLSSISSASASSSGTPSASPSSSSSSSSSSLSPVLSVTSTAPIQLLPSESKSINATSSLKQNNDTNTTAKKSTPISTQSESSTSNTATSTTEEAPKVNGTSSTTIATTTSTSAPAPRPAPVKAPTSWAALLKPTGEKTKSPVPNASSKTRPAAPSNVSSIVSSPKKFTGLADIIYQYEPTYTTPLLEPRGMINNVNTCFMNVILQPLSHCPPFYNMIKTIGQHVAHSFKSQTPLLDSLIEFVNEFRPQSQDGEYGEPFVPEYVYDALRDQKRFDSLRGRQEDAEEFLCFLLDGLHEEMIDVVKEQLEKHDENKKRQGTNGSDSWLEVGQKNKTATLRTAGYEDSPIKKLFGGTGRSVLRCPGAKDSVTVESYQSLPLDIQPDSVHSIEDAIRNATLPEIMHDYMSPKGVRVDATKQVYLENLPPVLILHVKRFVYNNVGGVQKLGKQVQYSSTMTIQQDWMARPSPPVQYQLFGVVYHHGKSAGGGHYTCDIKRQNGEWLHVDDTTIVPVNEEDVLVSEQNTQTSEKKQADQTPYILFYMRC